MTTFTGESLTSFDGVPFRIMWDADAVRMAAWSRTSIVVENHIPGTDDTEIDLMGFTSWKRSFRLELADKYVLRDLRKKQQTEGVLYVPANMNDMVEPDVTEVLVGISDVFARIPDVLLMSLTDEQVQVDGLCFATALFCKEAPDG
jgi:hypothetical protein